MPLSRLILILAVVIATAAATVGAAALLASAVSLPGLGLAVAVPAALVAWVFVRAIAARIAR